MPLSMNTPRPEMPIDVGGELIVTVPDAKNNVSYSIRVFPAANNEELRNARQPMKFYFCPSQVFLAANPDGSYKYQLVTYQGEFSENTNAGVAANASLAGGICQFTTTMKIPDNIMEIMKKKLREEINGKPTHTNHRLYRGIASDQAVSLVPVTIIDAQVLVHNLEMSQMTPEDFQNALGPESFIFDVQGNGPGSTSYAGENAYTIRMGMQPAAMMQEAMLAKRGEGKALLTAQYAYKYKIAASAYKIKIDFDAKSTYHHFSSQFKANVWFASVDIQRVFEKLRKEGVITVDITFDEEFIDKDAEKFIQEHKAEILNKFMAMGAQTIFDAQPPQVTPAQAKDKSTILSKAFGLFSGIDVGLSYSMKKVDQIKELDLSFEETLDKVVVRSNTISSNLTEVREAVAKDKKLLDKYFSKLFLADAFKVVYVAAHSNAFWRTADNPKGDPIHSLGVQVSYPITNKSGWSKITKAAARYIDPQTGQLSAHETDATWTPATKDRVYIFRFDLYDDLPEADQQKVEVIRTVSFQEDPDVVTNAITLKEVTEDHKLEVRAESAGKFGVTLSMENAEVLASTPRIKVMVICQVDGMQDRVFQFDQKNALSLQPWNIWYAKKEDIKPIKYRVDVSLSGKTILDKMLKWGTPDWLEYSLDAADGVLSVPFPDIPEDMLAKAEQYLSASTPTPQPTPVPAPQPVPVSDPVPVSENGNPTPQPAPAPPVPDAPVTNGNGTPVSENPPAPIEPSQPVPQGG